MSATSEGLTQAEAEHILQEVGYNELPESHVNPLRQLLTYFNGPIPWMIEAAAVLSALVRHWPDFIIILVLLIANAAVGFWEEFQAGNAIAALKSTLALRARVKRDGRWTTVPARELVPGDLLRLRMGDIIPADAELREGYPVEVDQSALTGESLPVTHRTGDTVYSGSILRQGEIEAEVTATGAKTYFGRTAQLVGETRTVSHFQQAVLQIGNYLIAMALVLVAVILTVALFWGDKMVTTLQFALVLTVAAVPVAMPTVLSVTMAIGTRLLAARQAIVSRLASIEELAGMDVLCSDKTGTLTQNKLTLGEPFCVGGVAAEEVILAGALASRAENQDTIDLAVLGGLERVRARRLRLRGPGPAASERGCGCGPERRPGPAGLAVEGETGTQCHVDLLIGAAPRPSSSASFWPDAAPTMRFSCRRRVARKGRGGRSSPARRCGPPPSRGAGSKAR